MDMLVGLHVLRILDLIGQGLLRLVPSGPS